MPWSFTYNGHSITHENDKCYMVPTERGLVMFTPDDVLTIDNEGKLFPCKKEIFEATYIVEKETTFIDRLQSEFDYLTDKSYKLMNFIESPKFNDIDPVQQDLLQIQFSNMMAYLNCIQLRLKLLSDK